MLPVIMPAGNRESGFWPNNLTPQLESTFLYRLLDLTAEEAGIPYIDHRSRKQPIGFRPIHTMVIGDFAFASRGKTDVTRSRRFITPSWGVVHAVRGIRIH